MSMDVNYTCKLGSLEVDNVVHLSCSISRPVAPNGTVGSRAHDISVLQITRRTSLHDGGSKSGSEIIDLLAASEQKSYFDGTITIAPPDDSANPVRTFRWEKGHVCSITEEVSGPDMTETIEVAVTELKVNNATFKRKLPA